MGGKLDPRFSKLSLIHHGNPAAPPLGENIDRHIMDIIMEDLGNSNDSYDTLLFMTY